MKAIITIEKWPEVLMVMRHGKSKANERKEQAKLAGQEPAWTDIERDQDSPLITLGHQQAYSTGVMIANLPPRDRRIDTIITSPYLRAKQTTEGVCRGMKHTPEIVVEERIREIEFGIMDGIDRATFRKLFPSEADRRERDGKYYYRPPGGENRPDVRLRVHSFLDTLNRDYVGQRVLVVCHSVVVLAFRSLIERWDEAEYLKVDKEDDVLNCGVTLYTRHENRKLILREYNTVAPLVEEPQL